MILQKDRVYSLIVGNEQGAVEIRDLQIRFSVKKTNNNAESKNRARVEIFNLSTERRKALEEDYVRVSLRVGYHDTEMVELFAGEVVNVSSSKNDIQRFNTKRQNTDLITVLEIDELFTTLNNTTVSTIVPAGKTVRDVILSVIKDIPEVTRHEMNGEGIKRNLPDGYPVAGSPRQILDNLSREYDIVWQIDSGVLYVSDYEGTFSDNKDNVPKVGQMSGLIERPEFTSPDSKRARKKDGEGTNKGRKGKVKKNTIKFKILLNPTIVAGSIIYLDFEDLSGYYKVDEVDHKGDYRSNEWYSTLYCTEKIE